MIDDCLNKVRCRFLSGNTRWHCVLLAAALKGVVDGKTIKVIPHKNCAINFKLKEAKP